jgi:hypothetical protein
MTNETRELVERLLRGPVWGNGEPIGSVVGAINGATMNEAAAAIQSLSERIAVLEGMIANPPKHRFWGAGEADCPREIKAGNGELHTLRCKVCGLDSPPDDFCRASLTPQEEHND